MKVIRRPCGSLSNSKLLSGRKLLPALPFFLFFILLAGSAALSAATLTWDPGNTSNGGTIDPGNGTWDLSSMIWNSVSGDVVWSQTSTTVPLNNAVFGGADGTYAVTVGGTQIAVTDMAFNNSGYTLSSGAIYLNGANDPALTVAANKTATINSAFTGINQQTTFKVNSGATLNLGGGLNTLQFVFDGGGTVNLTTGVYTPNLIWTKNITLDQKSGVTVNLAAGNTVFVGYGGSDIYTVESGATLTLGAGGSLRIAQAGGVSGTMNSAGTVTVGNFTAASLVDIGSYPGPQTGILNVTAGTFTVASGNAGSMILVGDTSGGGGNDADVYQVNVSGGILNTPKIQYGNASTAYSTKSSATLNVSGGTLYVGAGGIANNPTNSTCHPANETNLFSSGTVGALADWACAMPIALGGSGGPVTFQAADSGGVAHNITLSGVLSGTQGFIKTGGGILSLLGGNTYSGSVTVNAGTLAVTTASTGAGAYSVANNAILITQVASAGTSLNMSSLTCSAGSTLNLDPNFLGNPTVPMINVSGALNPTASVIVNVTGTTLTVGQFPLIKYGSLGGSGFAAFVLGSITLSAGLSASLVNNTTNHSIDLNLTAPSTSALVWSGAVNGNWDLAFTANWNTNAYYMESNGAGPVVIFNDAASGLNSAVVLNTMVSPAAVVVSNVALAYNINGSGGIAGLGSLLKQGSGTLTLGGHNTFTGGTTVSGGTLTMTAGNDAVMGYSVNNGTLKVSVAASGSSLAMSSLTLGNGSPQLSFDFGNVGESSAPAISDSGNVTMNGNVTINVANLNLLSTAVAVLLQYAGRSGTGNFVAGTMPGGVTLFDDVAHQQVLAYKPGLRVVVPPLNTNELVVAVTTPQEYGAKGDGTTDDSTAFQNAMNAVYNSGGFGGGVVYVPSGNYAFYTNITIPTGVTLHGDWQDWTKSANGLVGTTFKVYYGAGRTNDTPFVALSRSAALRDINFWYPNQNAVSVTGYPFTIGLAGAGVVQNVALVNSYQGIQGAGAALFILSTVVGTPLFMGITVDMAADISHTEDIRFSPDAWPASGLTNAPAAGGAHATWMRANGEGLQLLRVDGLINMQTYISGYKVGIEANNSTNGVPGAAFYSGSVSNCATALLAQEMQGQSGLEFTRFTLDGDIAVSRTHATNDATIGFDHCLLIGRNGTAVYSTGADWHSWMAFQDCTISNTLQLAGPGVFNAMNCTLLGSTQCVISAIATRAAFTGCFFRPTQKIVNAGNTNMLIVDGRRSISNALPMVNWTNVANDYLSRKPVKTDLYVATIYGATGNGVADDTAAIQNALTAAGNNGGGIVYLPGGMYHLTNTLDVPAGVELHGPYEMRHVMWPGSDNIAKGAVLQPYGGQGTTNGPVAIALEANSGAVGLSISYETQNTNCIPFPATIQGRGGNIFLIGVCCPNPCTYVDFDTYACTNHLIYMVDGWAINRGYLMGNGSSGSIVDCQANTTYWWDNYDSQSDDITSWRNTLNSYAENNLKMYVLGNCTELLVGDFAITENTFMDCIAENGKGPNVTGISAMCDESVQGFVLDAAAPCTITDVNPSWFACFSSYGLSNSTVAVISTTNFQGTARFFNAPLFGGPKWDYIVNGGDVGFELVHMLDHAFNGSSASGGVLHLINNGAYITYTGTSNFPPYNVTFGTSAGISGKVSEIIGGYAYNGCTDTNLNTNNPVLAWVDYNLSSHLVAVSNYTVTPPTLQSGGLGAGATMSWPWNIGAFNLCSTTNLTPPAVWTMVTNTPSLTNRQWTVQLPGGKTGMQFYRLQQ